MNAVVTLAAAATGGLRWHAMPAYFVAQIAGAIIGVWLAHMMFDLPILQLSEKVRTGLPLWGAEIVATFGLFVVIWGCRAHKEPVTGFAVAAYITGAYWFTASTSFANPVVTIARSLSNAFAGIRARRCTGLHRRAVFGVGPGSAASAEINTLTLSHPYLRWPRQRSGSCR